MGSAHSSIVTLPSILSRKTNNLVSFPFRNCILTILNPLSKIKGSKTLYIFFSVEVFAIKFNNKGLQKKRALKPKIQNQIIGSVYTRFSDLIQYKNDILKVRS